MIDSLLRFGAAEVFDLGNCHLVAGYRQSNDPRRDLIRLRQFVMTSFKVSKGKWLIDSNSNWAMIVVQPFFRTENPFVQSGTAVVLYGISSGSLATLRQ